MTHKKELLGYSPIYVCNTCQSGESAVWWPCKYSEEYETGHDQLCPQGKGFNRPCQCALIYEAREDERHKTAEAISSSGGPTGTNLSSLYVDGYWRGQHDAIRIVSGDKSTFVAAARAVRWEQE